MQDALSDRPSALTLAVDSALADIAAEPPTQHRLERQLRLLAKWRSQILANTLAAGGQRVRSGPFQGMNYAVLPCEGSRIARLLGLYEAALHPVFEAVIAKGCSQILDIGCAEGYYAVGMAMRMPHATVYAHDINPVARDRCASLAALNKVGDRVVFGGEITTQDLDLCAEASTFVLCDIEGAEDLLLDPVRAPALLAADLLVEVHEAVRPGLLSRLSDRFSATHRVTRLDRVLRPDLLPQFAERLSDLDQLLLLWEWRKAPTPWLWMERR